MKPKTTGNKPNLPKRKIEEFCLFYKSLGNAVEAARRIGLEDPELSGLELLYSKRVKRELARLSRPSTSYESVRSGLERLAFGSISDAVKLIRDEGEANVTKLDLYNVSEIKKVKGGGVEIKFFDRLDALEKLLQIEESFGRSATAESFFSALESARSASENEQAGDEP